MRANENIMIVDEQLVLVPYRLERDREEHVAKYHEWMSDPQLQELTASEPLSLEEEYEMQKKWQLDEDKLTFIICSRTSGDPSAKVTRSDLAMIGDVNMFLKGEFEDPEFEVEVEIMIAEPAFRRKGLALTALQLLLSYATSSAPSCASYHAPLPVPKEKLVVRIGEKNEPSKRLFEKLGFAITKRVEVFEEIEMRFQPLPSDMTVIRWRTGDVRNLTLL